MGFDAKKFRNAQLNPRQKKISVDELKHFFDGDPIWVVRGLSGQELGRCNEAAERHRTIRAVAEGLAGNDRDKSAAIAKLVGSDGGISGETARRLEMLQCGSVDPVCTSDMAVTICTAYGVVFYQLTNEILALTGQGYVLGKPAPSGETTA